MNIFEHSYKLCTNTLYRSTVTNMANVQTFEVMYNKFDVVIIRT
jgi:hypothetical protein